jgi:hypothetical protein
MRGGPVTVGFPGSGQPREFFRYSDFICLNQPSSLGAGDQPDGDTTFWFRTDAGQIADRQPNFYLLMDQRRRDEIEHKLRDAQIEGEILMFGRAADCGDDGADTADPLFPGWAERAPGSSVLFNGRRIRVIVPAGSGGPPSPPNFATELSFGDPVRVTGALVFDTGHDGKLEIHPVYAIDKITATFSANLSGAWADADRGHRRGDVRARPDEGGRPGCSHALHRDIPVDETLRRVTPECLAAPPRARPVRPARRFCRRCRSR